MCQYSLIVLQLLFIYFLVSYGSSSSRIHKRTKRIAENDFEGVERTKNNVSYLIELYYKDTFGEHFLCSGVLIHPQIVITAAHCISQIRLNALIAKSSLKGVKSRRISEVDTPQAYGEHFNNYDIAILKIDLPFSIESELIRPIQLGECQLENGDKLQVSGYRRRLQNTTYMSWHKCSKQFTGNVKILNIMFCGIPEEHSLTCSNDAGGPVVHDGKLCGITLWSEGWFDTKTPEVYISINAVRRFLYVASRF